MALISLAVFKLYFTAYRTEQHSLETYAEFCLTPLEISPQKFCALASPTCLHFPSVLYNSKYLHSCSFDQ